jgi:hypothetical protein
VALNLDGLDCSGKVFLGRGFTAHGEVRAVGARVRDELTCSGGHFSGRGGSALLADGLVCAGSVYLNDGFEVDGSIYARGLKVGGTLVFRPGAVPTVRYGYETQRVIAFVAVLWLASIYPFHLAQTHHVMQPASSYSGPTPGATRCTAAYPCFVPAVYSLEILFPVINPHQVAYWLPSGVSPLGRLLWVYVWCAILLGWVLSIAVAGGIGHLFGQKDRVRSVDGSRTRLEQRAGDRGGNVVPMNGLRGRFLPAVLISLLLTGCAHGGARPDPTPTPAGQPPATGSLATGSPARLSVSGSQVLDPQGHNIVLRGYNWGQWGAAQQQDAADNLAQGANSVRIPLRWWGDWKSNVDSRDPGAPGHVDPAHLSQLDRYISWATSQHLWVVLFLDSNFGQGANASKDNFWTDPAMKQQFIEVWQFLVARYLHTPYIAAYELLAEPHPPGVSDSAVKDFYDTVISAVRRTDTRTPLVVGPNQDYSLKHLMAAYTTVDRNVIYTGDYFIFDNPLDRMPDIQAFQQRYRVPVWINQVGIPSGNADSQTKARAVLGALNAAGVGWAWWTYRVFSASPETHGIYYQTAGGGWLVKQDWLTLVDGYLHPS